MQVSGTSRTGSGGLDQRRAYPRYIVNLRGTCCLQGQLCSDVEIRDFCLGGMYLVYAPTEANLDQLVLAPSQGDIIEVHFTLPTRPDKSFQVFGRVVRSDLKSMGIAFVQPNSAVLEEVLNFAIHSQNQPLPASREGEPAVGMSHEELMQAVRHMATNPVRKLIEAYLVKQSQVLLEMADKSIDINEQNAYFNAMEVFKKRGLEFKASFVNNMHFIVESKPEPIDATHLSQNDQLAQNGLSLVDDDAIDDWIARSDISGKAESAHFDELVGIEQRLSVLLDMHITKQNNPLGPEAFSRAFQEALKRLGLGKTAYLVCCKIFRDVLKIGVGQFYKDVNHFLLRHKVLPELHYEIKVHENAGKAIKQRRRQTDLDHAREFLDALDDSGGKNLYDLISHLQSLKHSQQNVADESLPYISTEKLLNKLTELGRISELESGAGEYESVSLKMLEQLQQGGGGEQLGSREAAIMEATGSIYDALYKDNIITPGVKTWLREVELPLLQEAIRDESVLADKGHIARAFINQLAKLELYNEEGRDYISNSVKRTIEGLLKDVAAHEGMEGQLMDSLLRKVSALVQTQNKAYNDNFNESIAQCEQQAELPKLHFAESFNGKLAADDPSLREWRKRIRRINPGDWILFGADSAESSRLSLAWISDNYDQYVFVNMLGLLEGTISVDELAMLLDNGTAIYLENAQEPAVDRAQYTMLQNMHTQLMHETTHDQLTGLLNRREFEKQMREMLLSEQDGDIHNALLLSDVDYFEVVNTTYGYEAGDRLLRELANLLRDFYGEQTLLGRVGGNQYALLLTNCDMNQAREIVEKQRQRLSRYRFENEESRNMVTLSTGIVAIDSSHGELHRLLQTAEAACRLAKSKGINCTQVVEMDDYQLEENKRMLAWVSKIDDSLAQNSLLLRYQPITPILDGELDPHCEILLGVKDDEGGLVSPESFILAAEKFRRMPDIDRWVVRNVFSYINQNPEVIDEIGGVAVNLSGLSINDESFIPFIMEQMEGLKIPTHYVTFEITETAGIGSLSNAAEFVNQIKTTGCSFSLDDFGTGMSTYSYLKNLPVDFIKIDGSFVRDIESNESDMAVVKSITEIGHFMGKKIIAECVERESTIDVLRELEVDYVQGYAISKPRLLSESLS